MVSPSEILKKVHYWRADLKIFAAWTARRWRSLQRWPELGKLGHSLTLVLWPTHWPLAPFPRRIYSSKTLICNSSSQLGTDDEWPSWPFYTVRHPAIMSVYQQNKQAIINVTDCDTDLSFCIVIQGIRSGCRQANDGSLTFYVFSDSLESHDINQGIYNISSTVIFLLCSMSPCAAHWDLWPR